MVIAIPKNASAEQIESARRMILKRQAPKQGLVRCFGTLKRNIDGVNYQNEMRNEWSLFPNR